VGDVAGFVLVARGGQTTLILALDEASQNVRHIKGKYFVKIP
jgi:hypothetical protein